MFLARADMTNCFLSLGHKIIWSHHCWQFQVNQKNTYFKVRMHEVNAKAYDISWPWITRAKIQRLTGKRPSDTPRDEKERKERARSNSPFPNQVAGQPYYRPQADVASLSRQKLLFSLKKRADGWQDPDARVCLRLCTNPGAVGTAGPRAGPPSSPRPPSPQGSFPCLWRLGDCKQSNA